MAEGNALFPHFMRTKFTISFQLFAALLFEHMVGSLFSLSLTLAPLLLDLLLCPKKAGEMGVIMGKKKAA